VAYNMEFAATADSLRSKPAIHVNQRLLARLPEKSHRRLLPRNLGEMAISDQQFSLVDAQSGVTSIRPR